MLHIVALCFSCDLSFLSCLSKKGFPWVGPIPKASVQSKKAPQLPQGVARCRKMSWCRDETLRPWDLEIRFFSKDLTAFCGTLRQDQRLTRDPLWVCQANRCLWIGVLDIRYGARGDARGIPTYPYTFSYASYPLLFITTIGYDLVMKQVGSRSGWCQWRSPWSMVHPKRLREEIVLQEFLHGKIVLRQGSNASKLLPVVLWQGFMEVFCKLVGSEAKVRCFFSENIHDLCVTVSAIARLGCKASLGWHSLILVLATTLSQSFL